MQVGCGGFTRSVRGGPVERDVIVGVTASRISVGVCDTRRVDESVKQPPRKLSFHCESWYVVANFACYIGERPVRRPGGNQSVLPRGCRLLSGHESCRCYLREGGVHICHHDCEGSVKVGALVLHHGGVW